MIADDPARVAKRLYARLLADKQVAPFFQGIDLDVQARKMACALSDIRRYEDPAEHQRLVAAHKPLLREGLTPEHFDRVVTCLHATLCELGLPDLEPSVVDALDTIRAGIFQLS